MIVVASNFRGIWLGAILLLLVLRVIPVVQSLPGHGEEFVYSGSQLNHLKSKWVAFVTGSPEHAKSWYTNSVAADKYFGMTMYNNQVRFSDELTEDSKEKCKALVISMLDEEQYMQEFLHMSRDRGFLWLQIQDTFYWLVGMFYAALAGEIDLQDHEQSVRQAVVAQAELEVHMGRLEANFYAKVFHQFEAQGYLPALETCRATGRVPTGFDVRSIRLPELAGVNDKQTLQELNIMLFRLFTYCSGEVFEALLIDQGTPNQVCGWMALRNHLEQNVGVRSDFVRVYISEWLAAGPAAARLEAALAGLAEAQLPALAAWVRAHDRAVAAVFSLKDRPGRELSEEQADLLGAEWGAASADLSWLQMTSFVYLGHSLTKDEQEYLDKLRQNGILWEGEEQSTTRKEEEGLESDPGNSKQERKEGSEMSPPPVTTAVPELLPHTAAGLRGDRKQTRAAKTRAPRAAKTRAPRRVLPPMQQRSSNRIEQDGTTGEKEREASNAGIEEEKSVGKWDGGRRGGE